MKLIVLFLVSFHSALFAQPWLPTLKPSLTLITPVVAQCNINQCQQNCYLIKSQCDRNDNSGCSAKTQACLQACTAECQSFQCLFSASSSAWLNLAGSSICGA